MLDLSQVVAYGWGVYSQTGDFFPMRFHRFLDDVLGQRSKVALLRLLVRSPGEYTGRDLARSLDLDHKTCHAALRDLGKQGIVRFARVGSAYVYSLNRDHIAVSDILVPLFESERHLLERYVSDLRRQVRTPIEAVILFGSVARQEEQPRSDVDLLLIARDGASAKVTIRKIDDATTRMLARYGSVPQILVSDVETFRDKIAQGDPLYGEILRTGRVIYGKSFAGLLRHGSQESQQSKRGAGRLRRSLA